MRGVYFVKVVGLQTTPHLNLNFTQTLCRRSWLHTFKTHKFSTHTNLSKELIAVLDSKKSSYSGMKKNLHFKQFHLNYKNNLKQKKHAHKISLCWGRCVSIDVDLTLLLSIAVNVSIGVDMVAETNNEVNVLSISKTYCYFSYVLSAVPKKVEFLEISKMM